MTKRSFGLTITLMTQIWGPTTIRVSGDESVAGQIKLRSDGGVQFEFPERLILIANHQVRGYNLTDGHVLTVTDLHRLALSLVDCICQLSKHAWTYLHHSQGVTQTHPNCRLGYAVL